MRYLVFLVALTLTASAADAQQRRGHAARARHQKQPTPRAEALSRNNIPPRMLLPAGQNRFPDMWRRGFFPGVRHNSGHRGSHWSKWPVWAYAASPYYGVGYGYGSGVGYSGYYAEGYAPSSSTVSRPEPATTRITGVLRLDITPATGLQYYVDGLYIGSSSELGTEFEVNAGARRIEVRANGYKPLVFDVRLAPGGTASFRGALEPLETVVSPPRAPGSRTMYVIPGCYMGNAPPVQANLPKGCDAGKAVTRGGA